MYAFVESKFEVKTANTFFNQTLTWQVEKAQVCISKDCQRCRIPDIVPFSSRGIPESSDILHCVFEHYYTTPEFGIIAIIMLTVWYPLSLVASRVHQTGCRRISGCWVELRQLYKCTIKYTLLFCAGRDWTLWILNNIFVYLYTMFVEWRSFSSNNCKPALHELVENLSARNLLVSKTLWALELGTHCQDSMTALLCQMYQIPLNQ